MEPTSHCRNCKAPLQGDYCGQCGQKHHTERFTAKGFFISFIQILTNFESGFWYTMKMMLIAPAQVVDDFVSGKTRPYYHPLRYTFIIVGISVLLNLYFGVFEIIANEFNSALISGDVELTEEARKSSARTQEAMAPFMNLIPLLLIPFVSFFSARLFRKGHYNYGEHLILNTFVLGQATVVGLPFSLLSVYLFQTSAYALTISVFLWGLYLGIITSKIFKRKVLPSIIKGICAYLLGYFGFLLSVFIIVLIVTLVATLVRLFISKLN